MAVEIRQERYKIHLRTSFTSSKGGSRTGKHFFYKAQCALNIPNTGKKAEAGTPSPIV